MLKASLDSLEGVDESLHQYYAETDNGYQLKVEGFEDKDDTGALKRAKEREKARAQAAEQAAEEMRSKVSDLEAKLEEIATQGHREKGDIEALESSWKAKYDKLAASKDGELAELNGALTKVLVENKAIEMASELAVEGSADVLKPHIRSRLAVDKRGDDFVTVVLDDAGKPTALTVEELKQEIASKEAFAPIIVGSKATGSGAAQGSGGGASTKPIDWSSATTAERVAAAKAARGEV